MTAPPTGALEACPFCGREAHLTFDKSFGGFVSCSTEGCAGNAHAAQHDRSQIIAAWNRRTHGPALLAALRLREEWIPVSERLPPDGELVEVYAPDSGNGELLDFDGVHDGLWIEHECRREHFLVVGGAAAAGPDCVCTGPTEAAPYTHWRRIVRPTADDLARVLEEGE